MSFVFYDLETTGTNTVFDQILQFAAVRTDADLKPIDRFTVRCRLLPWVIPSPGALAVTGVTAEILFDQSLPTHFEMMRQVRAKLVSWSPSTFVGFNSLRFDEDVLRRALWQTLHPPYLTVTDGNRRLDVLVLARAAAELVPDALVVPIGNEGKGTFRLDKLAPANGFVFARAHEALSDAEATLFIARRIRDRASAVWNNGVSHAPKAVANQILSKREPLFFTQGDRGWFGLPIGNATTPGERVVVANLSGAWTDLHRLPVEGLCERLAKSSGLISLVAPNRAPFFLEAETAATYGRTISVEQSASLEVLRADQAFRARILSNLPATAPNIPEVLELEERIFEGFPDHRDIQLMKKFHDADWAGRRTLLNEFKDQKLRLLGRRLCFADAPRSLENSDRESIVKSIVKRLTGPASQGRWRNVEAARMELAELDPNSHVADTLSVVERKLLGTAETG